MKIKQNTVYVEDQDRALAFYTDVLGFLKNLDIPLGKFRSVVSPKEPNGAELILEPIFKNALFEQGIPFTAFAVDDIKKELGKLQS